MPTTDHPLEPIVTESGLAKMPPITTESGATLTVHDSSSTEPDELWLVAKGVQLTLDGECRVAVSMVDALTFACQIIALGDRRGYRLDDPTDEPDTEVIDGLVDELDHATAKLNAVLPPSGNETRSDSGDILELGAYLATVYTAAALAGAIPRRIGDLDITAYTSDIGTHLESAAEAARREIHDLALGPDVLGEPEHEQARVFPPRPYHLNSAGDYLTGLRTNALALAANAEAVLAEIECYLEPEDPEPDPIPEYARDLLNGTTNTESE